MTSVGLRRLQECSVKRLSAIAGDGNHLRFTERDEEAGNRRTDVRAQMSERYGRSAKARSNSVRA
jgi:hypothetical protein